jgi:hypothetical protein
MANPTDKGGSGVDWFARILSIVALLVTIGTFTYDKVSNQRAEDNKRRHVAYIATQLAYQFVPRYVLFIHTKWRDPTTMRRERAGLVRNVQQDADGLAAQLGLQKLEDFIPAEGGPSAIGANGTMFDEPVFTLLFHRIRELHDEESANAFLAMSLLGSMFAEAGVLLEPGNADQANYIASYAKSAGALNDLARKLDVAAKVDPTSRDVATIQRQLLAMQAALNDKYAKYRDA